MGGTLFATLALLGLAALLHRVEGLYVVLRFAGGIYLVWLGVRIWRGASEPLTSTDIVIPHGRSFLRSFSFALATQLSNPKTAVVYGSIFAAMLPNAPPSWLMAVLPPLVFTVEAAWYAFVALTFSAQRPRALYVRGKTWIDRVAGGVMGLLGVRLIVDALTTRRL